MTVQQGRNWIVLASLISCGATFVFFVLAPVFGYPLLWRDSARILELISPVFVGYVGAAAYYVTHQTGKHSEVSVPIASRDRALIIKGPVILFAIVSVAILIAFGRSNAQTAEQGIGMSVENLAFFFTLALGFLTGVTNYVVSHLFSKESELNDSK